MSSSAQVGDEFEVEVGPVAHGGHCVARYNGQVVFVRHSLPGETVGVRVTEVGPGGRFVRADAVHVLVPSADRRPAPCPQAGPGLCGGCDWQHVAPSAQRQLKAEVVSEAMRRIGGLEVSVPVEAVPGDDDGLGWRTRATFAVAPDGRVAFRRHRSHDLVTVDDCLLLTDAARSIGVTEGRWKPLERISVVATSTGDRGVVVHPVPQSGTDRSLLLDRLPDDIAVAGVRGSARVRERVGAVTFSVPLDGFWQVHPGAASTLTATVVDALGPRLGDHVVDLYSGAGLFGITMVEAVGPGGRIDLVESDSASCAAARRTVHAHPTVRVHEAPVDRWLARQAPARCDLVVLDPPEAGAGRAVLERAVRLAPRAIAYVSCDPAALARDVRTLGTLGWTMTTLRAFDLFPMTHHIECVAAFRPRAGLTAPPSA